MSCYLRLNLTRAASERLLADWPFGRRRRPIQATLSAEKKPWRTVGINVLVSDAVDDFATQLVDARRFLRRHAHTIATAMRSRGVTSGCLDFGVEDAIDGGRGPAVVMYFRFSPALIELAASARLDLEFSIYPAAVPEKKGKSGSQRLTRKSAARVADR
jgi:hypothetical protein